MSHVPDHSAAPAQQYSTAGGAVYRSAGSLEIGATLSEAMSVFGRRFVPLVILMVVLFIPLALIGFALGAAFAAGGSQVGLIIASVITAILGVFASLLAQTAATVAVVDDLRQRPFSIGSALSVTSRRLMPILGVTVLATLAILLGTILLIIPGIILTIMFYVAVPSCAVERTGATESLGRSRQLTSGHRWRIFALVLIVGVVAGIIGAIVEYIGRMFGLIPSLVVDVLWKAVSGAFGAVMVAVVYYRLRILKDGVDIAAIANVFD